MILPISDSGRLDSQFLNANLLFDTCFVYVVDPRLRREGDVFIKRIFEKNRSEGSRDPEGRAADAEIQLDLLADASKTQRGV